MEREREELGTKEMSARLYYDYEGRFIKQRLERDHMRMLPRVVKPSMFRTSGHVLGDVRVFERFTVGPVSALTCGFLELGPRASTPESRRIPIKVLYCLTGGGTVVVDGEEDSFEVGDVAIVPPYTRHRIVAGAEGLRAWVPETRFWHVLGLLWHEHFEPHELVGDAEPVYDQEGTWTGYRFGRGLLGLDREIVVPAGADKRRSGLFEARRLIRDAEPDGTRYDELVELLVKDNQRHDSTPHVIRSTDRPFEDTRGGRMKFLIDNWSGLAGQDLDMAEYEIAAGKRSGAHRHIAEELLLVIEGSGFDDHDGSTHPWEAGDLICIPPMTAHAHVNNGNETARLVGVWSHHPANEFLGGFEHIEDATGWSSDH